MDCVEDVCYNKLVFYVSFIFKVGFNDVKFIV